jgi:F-type H+-transporting ATPase subunit alpha
MQLLEFGHVVSVTDGIAYVTGLESAFAGEVVQFNNNILGLVVNLEENLTGVTIFGNDKEIVQGDKVERLFTMLEIPVSLNLLGRTIDALGNIIDTKDEMEDETEYDMEDKMEELLAIQYRPIEIKAPGIISRTSVNEPLLTGLIAIDSMIPIGRGQRELIIGDRQTGKTAIAIDTIINQY